MPTKLYNKLVRDKVPEIMRAGGEEPKTRVLDETEYKKQIRLKLLADAGEVRVAASRDDLVKELADVLEIVESIAAVEGIPLEDVRSTQTARRAERGGFGGRTYLVSGETR